MCSRFHLFLSIGVSEAVKLFRLRVVRGREYNPQGGSLLACIVTQGRLRYTCQPCAIESITPMGYGYTAWFGVIECTMGNGTPHGLVEIGRGGACVPARVALQGRIHRSSPAHNTCIFWYGNAAARPVGRARRRRPYVFCLRELRVDVRPYGFVWVDYA